MIVDEILILWIFNDYIELRAILPHGRTFLQCKVAGNWAKFFPSENLRLYSTSYLKTSLTKLIWLNTILTSCSIQQHLLVRFTLSVHSQPLRCLNQGVRGVLNHLEGRRHVLLELLILSASYCLLPNLQPSWPCGQGETGRKWMWGMNTNCDTHNRTINGTYTYVVANCINVHVNGV